ncbi:MAG TPA: GxxExxY protein [Chryseosolibacter sp.]
MKFQELTPEEEAIGKAIVDAAYKVHYSLGPGLLEKIYEVCLAYELKKAGYGAERQVTLPIHYDGIAFDEGLRIDILVEDLVITEVKAVDLVHAVWQAQVLSHLKLTKRRLGFIINFNVTHIKHGIKRIVL